MIKSLAKMDKESANVAKALAKLDAKLAAALPAEQNTAPDEASI